jgi:formate hydrogenlyase subunit 4
MIHEGMLLEASGPRLAVLVYAAQLKLVLVAGLFAAAFLPIGLASSVTPVTVVVALVAAVAKLVGAAVVLGILDASLAKIRILALPALLTTASIIAAVGLAARLWLPA